MNKFTFTMLFLGVLIGCVVSYIMVDSSKDDYQAKTEALQMELMKISNKLSTFESTSNMQSGQYERGLQDQDSVNFEKSGRYAGELSAEIQKTIARSLEEQFDSKLSKVIKELQSSALIMKTDTLSVEARQKTQAAKATSDAVLGNALEKGLWENSDKQAFSDALDEMSGEDQFEAQRQLSVAINNGDIQMPDDVTLF